MMGNISLAEISRIRKLHQRKYRAIEKKFIVEGSKLIMELLTSGWVYESIYCSNARVLPPTLSEAQVSMIGSKEMSRISCFNTEPGLLAVVEMPSPKQFEHDSGVILMLDGIQDPGNLGTIIRTADWFGVSQIILSKTSVELYNPKVVQATMGSVFRVSCYYMDLPEVISSFTNTTVLVSDVQGNSSWDQGKYNKLAIVIGSESQGVSKEVADKADHLISIPGAGGKADSLNAAVACGIILSRLC